MAVSRKKKIIIGVVVGVVLAVVVVVSVIATRKEEPEVVTVKINVRPELKQTVTSFSVGVAAPFVVVRNALYFR